MDNERNNTATVTTTATKGTGRNYTAILTEMYVMSYNANTGSGTLPEMHTTRRKATK